MLYGVQGGELSRSTYAHVWECARKAALTADEYTSPLAKRPYDLRHAAVSTWLSAGVSPTQVAEWAGHSVNVLLQIYAKCLAGQEEVAWSASLGCLGRSGFQTPPRIHRGRQHGVGDSRAGPQSQ